MFVVYIVLALCLISIRFLAGYDSRVQKGKYFLIKNRFLRIALVDEWSFFDKRKRLTKDINKISVTGFIYYVISGVIITGDIMLMSFVPEMDTVPWELEIGKYSLCIDTFNKRIAATSICLLFFAVIVWAAFRLIVFINNEEHLWIRILAYIVVAVIILTVGFAAVLTVKDTVMCMSDLSMVV
ncbi:MAG: hypothetical protein ACI3YE_06890 [Candidatus Avispirillum sp.]